MYSKYLDYSEAATRANYAAQAENEQKDVLISSLKQDLYQLRQLESDFHRLNELIINLEGKYSLLLDEKDRSEKQQRIKADIDKSTIMQLKDQIDAVRIQLQRITAECDDLQRDNTGMKRMSDARAGEIQNIRYEIKAAEAKNQRANDQNRNLSVTVKGLKEERKRLEDQCDNLSALLDANIAKLKNIQKHVRNSESNNARLDKTLHQAESDNAKLVSQLKQRSDQAKRAENKLKSLRNNIDELQLNFRNISQQAEKNKADAGNNAANLQNQLAKGKQLTVKIQHVQSDIYGQEKELDVINIESEKLRRQHSQNLNRNKYLNEEVDKLLALINEYESVNKELVDEIEIYMDQDEQARSILNRRQNMKEIIESTMRKVAMTGEPIKHLKY